MIVKKHALLGRKTVIQIVDDIYKFYLHKNNKIPGVDINTVIEEMQKSKEIRPDNIKRSISSITNKDNGIIKTSDGKLKPYWAKYF